jgi:hypothetical protein
VIRTSSMRLEQGHRYLLNPSSVDRPRGGDWRPVFAVSMMLVDALR